MRRIYPDFTYSDAPRAGCWWAETCTAPDRPPFEGENHVDVAIIGGGFTGISSALHLAETDVSVAVLEANYVGWGASGRNGGFCCLGGGMLEDAALDQRVGRDGRLAWRQAEVAAVGLVEGLINRLGLDVDRHSNGETQLAHRPRDYADMQRQVDSYAENYGFEARLTPKGGLAEEGMNAGFEGAITIPVGFGLNPFKYLTGIAAAAEAAGAALYRHSPVTKMTREGEGFALTTPKGTLRADRVIIGTNGYSSEHLPDWFAGRYLPTQSTVIVTRPLTPDELQSQGWTSGQMAYDTRHLLHYFRLMPDNRMLFGVRGGILSAQGSERRAIQRAQRDFKRMFPAWRGVRVDHAWSGLVCIARDQMPFIGQVPDAPGLFASLCYHGNGVAMASYAGALLADLVQDKEPTPIYPDIVKRPLKKFELGRWRRALLPAAYARFMMSDLDIANF